MTVNLMDVFFSDSQNGIVVGTWGTILQTRNRGVTWSRETTDPLKMFYNEVIMIKCSLFFLIIAFLFTIRAEAQMPYGILGGINRANLSVSHADGNEDFDF